MTTEQFAFWLHGYSEITNRRLPNETEWKIINDHLDLVFKKETPDRYTPPAGYATLPGYSPAVLTFNGSALTGSNGLLTTDWSHLSISC